MAAPEISASVCLPVSYFHGISPENNFNGTAPDNNSASISTTEHVTSNATAHFCESISTMELKARCQEVAATGSILLTPALAFESMQSTGTENIFMSISTLDSTSTTALEILQTGSSAAILLDVIAPICTVESAPENEATQKANSQHKPFSAKATQKYSMCSEGCKTLSHLIWPSKPDTGKAVKHLSDSTPEPECLSDVTHEEIWTMEDDIISQAPTLEGFPDFTDFTHEEIWVIAEEIISHASVSAPVLETTVAAVSSMSSSVDVSETCVAAPNTFASETEESESQTSFRCTSSSSIPAQLFLDIYMPDGAATESFVSTCALVESLTSTNSSWCLPEQLFLDQFNLEEISAPVSVAVVDCMISTSSVIASEHVAFKGMFLENMYEVVNRSLSTAETLHPSSRPPTHLVSCSWMFKTNFGWTSSSLSYSMSLPFTLLMDHFKPEGTFEIFGNTEH